MLVIAALLLGAAVGVGFYAHQNPGSHDVNLFGYSWTGVYDWVPVAIAAAVVGLICAAALGYDRVRINRLRRTILQLRVEKDLLRAVPVTTPAAVTPAGRLVAERDAAGQRSGWYERGGRRFWWFGGSRRERKLARQHEMARPAAELPGRPVYRPPSQPVPSEQPFVTATPAQHAEQSSEAGTAVGS